MSIPYNVIKLGDKMIGVDSYFWGHVVHDARKALLIRPAEALEGNPLPGSIILDARVSYKEQLNDLNKIRRMSREAKARIREIQARIVLRRPLARRPSQAEYRVLRELLSASYILEDLSLDQPQYHGIKWLHLRIHDNGLVTSSLSHDLPDKIYQWLASEDEAFGKELSRILARKGYRLPKILGIQEAMKRAKRKY